MWLCHSTPQEVCLAQKCWLNAQLPGPSHLTHSPFEVEALVLGAWFLHPGIFQQRRFCGQTSRPRRKGLEKRAIDGIPIRKAVPTEPGAPGKSGAHLYCSNRAESPCEGFAFRNALWPAAGGRMGEKEDISHSEKFKLHLLLGRGWLGAARPTKKQCGLATVRGHT